MGGVVYIRNQLMVLLFTLFFVVIFSGAVSAASLNLTDAESGATAVKNYTTSTGHIPGSVVVSDKNSTSASFLNTLSTYIVELDNGDSSTVTIAKVNNATGPSGTGNGTLQRSEYVTVANNVKNFISTNGRVPNYSSSSLGNIRYESLVYAFAKILDFYAANGRLPNTASVTYIAGVDSTSVVVTNSLFSDVNTGKTFSSVQSAINDPTTLSGHIIQAQSGTYTENVNVNKKVTIKPVSGGSVTFEAVNPFSPVFNITASGATIHGLRISNAFNSTGINLNAVTGCNITVNNLFNNYIAIGLINSKSSNVLNNTMHDNLRYGIFLVNSNSTMITGNSITGGLYGINPQNSNATIQFNRINGCSQFALVVQSKSIITATNNWWGTNTPTYISSTNWVSTYYDIYNYGNSTITYNPWIVLKSSANPTTTSNNSTVTADLTHNNAGTDTSPSGHIPDNQVVNFSTNGVGAIISTTRTKNGKATAIFNRGTIITSGTAVITSTFDDQSVTTNITIGGTITDLNTGKTFSTIQAAINDVTTSNGDTIALNSGIYTENVVVNKTLTIMPVSGATVTVQALNPSSPVFNLTRNGIIIQGMTIRGSTNNQSAIYIHSGASNCIINGNTITNNYVGINNVLSNNTQIINNNITNYSSMGINMGTNLIYTNNTLIQNNTINTALSGVTYGIHFGYCKNTTIIYNSILWLGSSTTGVTSLGINAQKDSSANIYFNRISGFTYFGVIDQNSTVNYTNNWWGTNNPVYTTDGNSNGDVCDPGAISKPYPYLVLKISASNPNIDPDNTCNITADLTTDNKGNNTSTSGNLPDGIPINFTSNLGTITNPAYTKNGKASATFSRGINTGIATITTTLDDQSFTINISISPVTDINTGQVFSTIQAAINDPTTNNGDTLELISGLYNENVVVNKTLTLMPLSGANVIVTALSSSSPTFTLAATGITIQGMTITGSTGTDQAGIYLTTTASNCIIDGNTITNNYDGINAFSNGNTIKNNNITNYTWMGINLSNLNYALIKNNNITAIISGVTYGIHFGNCNNINIIGNSISSILGQISDDNIGINAQASTANINFNRIVGFTYFGLIDQQSSTVNYADNWWGTNNPVYTTDGNSNGDVCDPNAITNPYPYLVLKLSPKDVGPNNSCKVTADLTQDNNGNNTSSSGSLPDGIPINFTSTLGTITTPAYTRNGKAVATFKAGSIYGNATIRATLDYQIVSTIVGIVHIYNNRTLTGYTIIQAAINGALNGDTIIVENGVYTENITINKKLTLASDLNSNAIINGMITINSDGSNSVIQDFIINGNINLYANNCTIYGNTITTNGTSAITTLYSSYNLVLDNTIIANGFDGINSTNSNNTYYGNEINGCKVGIYSNNSTDTITSNDLTNNYYGIWTYNSTDTVQFNRIAGNTVGLRNDLGTVNATDNWWGSNADPSTLLADIYVVSGTINSSSWLVLSVNTSTTNSGGKTSVTADLTHDNTGADTSSKGHIPDGIPVNYNTTFGTIIGTAYTIKGKSSTILNLGTIQNATVTTYATLDNQNVSTTGLIATGVAVLNITSTAYDNSTNLPLNISCNIPLNDSVIWVSALWKPVTNINGYKAEELQVIVNGNVMQDVYIYNYSNQTTDSLTFNLSYPGVSGLNMTVVDPNSNTTSILNFPGNNINRTSQITYNGTSYEGVRSFAIATTEVTSDIFNYWLSQSTLYQGTSLEGAYTTFLTALMVEYTHDQIADNITNQCNVTWTRTSPIIVSVCDSPNETYLTLECDHSMGMTIVGAVPNMWMFNYITSASISPIEYNIFNYVTGYDYQCISINSYFGSVVTDIMNDYVANNDSIEVFNENTYVVETSKVHNYDFIVIDRGTGIVRDINTMNNLCGLNGMVYGPEMDNQMLTTWYGRYIAQPGDDTLVTGPINFNWDGTGRVLIMSGGLSGPGSNPNSNEIWSIGTLTVYTDTGSIPIIQMAIDYAGASAPDADITDYLYNGTNNITVIVNAHGLNWMGCSVLYAVHVALSNAAYHHFQIVNTPASGKNINLIPFAKLILGVTKFCGGVAIFAAGVGGEVIAPEATPLDIYAACFGATATWDAAWDIDSAYMDEINKPFTDESYEDQAIDFIKSGSFL